MTTLAVSDKCIPEFLFPLATSSSPMKKRRTGRSHLNTILVRREDGSVQLLVYRKKSHTDQYLNFSSHLPLNHKLAVIRTLLERRYSIVNLWRKRMTKRMRKNTLLKRSVSVATLPGPSIGSNRTSWRNLWRTKQRKQITQEAITKVWLSCHMWKDWVRQNSEISRHRHS